MLREERPRRPRSSEFLTDSLLCQMKAACGSCGWNRGTRACETSRLGFCRVIRVRDVVAAAKPRRSSSRAKSNPVNSSSDEQRVDTPKTGRPGKGKAKKKADLNHGESYHPFLQLQQELPQDTKSSAQGHPDALHVAMSLGAHQDTQMRMDVPHGEMKCGKIPDRDPAQDDDRTGALAAASDTQPVGSSIKAGGKSLLQASDTPRAAPPSLPLEAAEGPIPLHDAPHLPLEVDPGISPSKPDGPEVPEVPDDDESLSGEEEEERQARQMIKQLQDNPDKVIEQLQHESHSEAVYPGYIRDMVNAAKHEVQVEGVCAPGHQFHDVNADRNTTKRQVMRTSGSFGTSLVGTAPSGVNTPVADDTVTHDTDITVAIFEVPPRVITWKPDKMIKEEEVTHGDDGADTAPERQTESSTSDITDAEATGGVNTDATLAGTADDSATSIAGAGAPTDELAGAPADESTKTRVTDESAGTRLTDGMAVGRPAGGVDHAVGGYTDDMGVGLAVVGMCEGGNPDAATPATVGEFMTHLHMLPSEDDPYSAGLEGSKGALESTLKAERAVAIDEFTKTTGMDSAHFLSALNDRCDCDDEGSQSKALVDDTAVGTTTPSPPQPTADHTQSHSPEANMSITNIEQTDAVTTPPEAQVAQREHEHASQAASVQEDPGAQHSKSDQTINTSTAPVVRERSADNCQPLLQHQLDHHNGDDGGPKQPDTTSGPAVKPPRLVQLESMIRDVRAMRAEVKQILRKIETSEQRTHDIGAATISTSSGDHVNLRHGTALADMAGDSGVGLSAQHNQDTAQHSSITSAQAVEQGSVGGKPGQDLNDAAVAVDRSAASSEGEDVLRSHENTFGLGGAGWEGNDAGHWDDRAEPPSRNGGGHGPPPPRQTAVGSSDDGDEHAGMDTTSKVLLICAVVGVVAGLAAGYLSMSGRAPHAVHAVVEESGGNEAKKEDAEAERAPEDEKGTPSSQAPASEGMSESTEKSAHISEDEALRAHRG